MTHMDTRQGLDLERQDSRKLRLSEFADVVDGEFGVLAGLRVEFGQRLGALGGGDFERLQLGLVEFC